MLYDSNRNGSNYEIYSMDTTGTHVVQLTNDPTYDSWWPRLSPDRRSVIFYRTPKGTNDRDYTKTSLWRMNWDGSGLTQLLAVGAYGWAEHGHAEWSPDGTKLVMFGGSMSNAQIVVTDASGANPVTITSGLASSYDPSWSPDGKRITYVSCPTVPCSATDFEVFTTSATPGGSPTRVSNDGMRDNDPYYSPDGTRIAWLTETSTTTGSAGAWNIRIANADGSSPGYITNDGNVNSRPQWSHDGTKVYFHRLVYSDALPHFDIWSVHPDGTGMTNITAGQPGSANYPSV